MQFSVTEQIRKKPILWVRSKVQHILTACSQFRCLSLLSLVIRLIHDSLLLKMKT